MVLNRKKAYFCGMGIEKHVHISDVKIRFQHSNKAKRLSISVKPFTGVKVTVPQSVSLKDAERFVREKQNWITKAIQKVQKRENDFTVFTEKTRFVTRKHALAILRSESNHIRVRVANALISVKVPLSIPMRNDLVQLAVRRGIEKAWYMEAEEHLPQRLEYLAEQHGFNYQNLQIKNTKSRWGSCTGTDDISLSLHLMRLPDLLIDYVLLHELCHTIHKNHGKGFWVLLNHVTGNARGLDKMLSEYTIRIY